MSVEAAIEGVSPNVDPTVITDIRLPDGYDQDFPDGMPFGYAVVGGKTPYAFGVGVDSEGNIYSASYETQTVFITKKDADGRISLFSPVERIELDAPGLFGLTLDRNDNIVFSGQLAPDGYVARYNRTTKTVTTLVSGLVRPNQMAVDPDNNVYIVTEDGSVFRYNDKDGTVDHLARGIDGFQSCCVDADGNLYILAFGRFSDVPLVGVGYAGGTLRKMTPDGTLETVWQGDDQYVWRARGLAIDDKGYVYMTGEGNVWDNGNSANIVRFDPALKGHQSRHQLCRACRRCRCIRVLFIQDIAARCIQQDGFIRRKPERRTRTRKEQQQDCQQKYAAQVIQKKHRPKSKSVL